MEYSGFYIDEKLGNNEFSYEKRLNKKIYIPPIIKVEAKKDDILNSINMSDKVAFSEIDENGKENNIFGLENFVYTQKNSKKIYIFDNHNHCFYFVSSNMIKDFELKSGNYNQNSSLKYDENKKEIFKNIIKDTSSSKRDENIKNTNIYKELKKLEIDCIYIQYLESFLEKIKKLWYILTNIKI